MRSYDAYLLSLTRLFAQQRDRTSHPPYCIFNPNPKDGGTQGQHIQCNFYNKVPIRLL